MMLFLIQAMAGLTTRTILRRESERRLKFATDRFQRHIRDMDVVLRDVNGPRGGIDKRCLLRMRLRRGGSLEVEETRSTFVGAIRAASKRLRRLLARRLGGPLRRRNRRRERMPFRRHSIGSSINSVNETGHVVTGARANDHSAGGERQADHHCAGEK